MFFYPRGPGRPGQRDRHPAVDGTQTAAHGEEGSRHGGRIQPSRLQVVPVHQLLQFTFIHTTLFTNIPDIYQTQIKKIF
jgi:hypothetical protein